MNGWEKDASDVERPVTTVGRAGEHDGVREVVMLNSGTGVGGGWDSLVKSDGGEDATAERTERRRIVFVKSKGKVTR
eukprot:CAMPEP_0206556368 /NCGR_PEP_ID=MMETSP0325_2-20121206/18377_1 /ASSEMBLY_ACC=CAM_ASM_000347 /TAXON_ID=2866 /ORGANISM="Crypthecodinium cohnii, Strain Seligo" /LENGTH=76 /DNA_ID=CAMNT_0054056905 /DNA_START=116 /DNA_END=346 /DNA_ORIENTATION=-